MADHPGPSELDHHKLTRAEMGAMLEHLFYRMKGDARADLARRMPDAYQRLTGQSDESMAMLLLNDTAERRRLALEHLAKPLGPGLDCAHNQQVRVHQRAKLGQETSPLVDASILPPFSEIQAASPRG